uniref:CDP-diacylglycerol--glycerol-3-phosphate 3-phosphatidyltransferase n=1 Tax=Ditylenchus dipsaci TaxID=166011 RepID=A0A915DTP0_9BILA
MKEEPELRVGLLLDFFRGTRTGNEGSVQLLQPLAKDAQIRFFHHPDMRGLLLNMLPERVNEIIGLQHMKFFIFDDSIILSGANLSDSYFTNRQDRYMLIDNNALCLNETGQLIFQGESSLHPFTGNTSEFRKVMSNKLDQIFADFKERIPIVGYSAEETFICPFLQLGSFNVHQEVNLLTKLFGCQDSDTEITMSTGYFNLYDTYANLILKKSKCPANGFYNGSGLSGYIPSLYVHNSYNFFRQASLASAAPIQRKHEITIAEYTRPKWTFHAKGIWIASDGMAATVVGSSNYGKLSSFCEYQFMYRTFSRYRSVFRDLEVGALLVTKNESLILQIAEEKKALMNTAR